MKIENAGDEGSFPAWWLLVFEFAPEEKGADDIGHEEAVGNDVPDGPAGGETALFPGPEDGGDAEAAADDQGHGVEQEKQRHGNREDPEGQEEQNIKEHVGQLDAQRLPGQLPGGMIGADKPKDQRDDAKGGTEIEHTWDHDGSHYNIAVFLSSTAQSWIC